MQKLRVILLFILLALTCANARAVHYRINHFGLGEGLPQTFVYAIEQDTKGYLWMGTGEGLCRFDGLHFDVLTTDDSLAEDFVNKLFLDSRGRMWVGHNQGGISYMENGRIATLDTRGVLKSSITSITEDEKGIVWISSLRDGVVAVLPSGEQKVYQLAFNKKNIFSMVLYGAGTLLIGSSEGVFQYQLDANGAPKEVGLVFGLPLTKVNALVASQQGGQYWVCTEDEGLHKLEVSGGTIPQFAPAKVAPALQLEMIDLQSVFEDADQNLWLSTFGAGVLKLTPAGEDFALGVEYNEETGLASNYTKSTMRDHEGNTWIATYGGGVAQVVDDHFTFYTFDTDSIISSFLAVLKHRDLLWVGQNPGLVAVDTRGKQPPMRYGVEHGLPDVLVSSLCLLNDSVVMVGTQGQGLFRFNINQSRFTHIPLSGDRLSLAISSVAWDGTRIWAGTVGGLFTVNPETDSSVVYNTTNGLMHNAVNHLLVDSKKRLWVATNTPYVTFYADNEFQHIPLTSGGELLNGTCLAEDEHGLIWLGTNGQGVFSISEQLIVNYNATNGLKSNYCYSLVSDGKTVWVGHRQGLSRIWFFKDIVRAYDKDKGFTNDCNPNAVFRESSGTIWFGTSNGALKFEPALEEENTVPPVIVFQSVQFNDDLLDPTVSNSLPAGAYKARFEFTGISFTDPQAVTYQYKLEGHDLEWSEASTLNFAQYTRLEDGSYTFLLRACNSDGFCSETPAEISIRIMPPLWKRWWFITLCVLLALYSVYLAFKIRERTHKRRQAYLQSELDKRTREVVEKKEEIERKNKDITDSITYALRIQSAILPDLEALPNLFEQSFIFYKPRDIVSGDFYWFQRAGNLRLVMAADCTGHGVPGSLVSMIGATLLKDICNRPEVQSPADLLTILDREMAETLRNKESSIHAQDGMDIIVAEVGDNGKVRISSAMRPFFVRHPDGRLEQHRGDRFSIGGSLMDLEKEFTNQEFTLEPGASIYLFSDGYPDQFGGPKGKKLKMSGMRNILESISGVPLNEQADAVGLLFEQWCQDYPQVDDVLVMGIQV